MATLQGSGKVRPWFVFVWVFSVFGSLSEAAFAVMSCAYDQGARTEAHFGGRVQFESLVGEGSRP